MAYPKLAIYGAIGADISITKFTAAGVTGGLAMLSEGVHSAAHDFNGVLLLVGIRLSQRPLRRSIRSDTAMRCTSGV